MKKIFKYVMRSDAHAFDIPLGGRLLHVHEQDGNIGLWFLVDPNNKPVKRKFFIVGTGFGIEDGKYAMLDYLGTAHIDGFVWHVFEEK
jgi:hypothetical protein